MIVLLEDGKRITRQIQLYSTQVEVMSKRVHVGEILELVALIREDHSQLKYDAERTQFEKTN